MSASAVQNRRGHVAAAVPAAAGAQPELDTPGRSCPISYRYTPAVFKRSPQWRCDTLFVVGGLYGNPYALQALLDRVARESGSVQVVFNGDFHWFDIDEDAFAQIERTVARHGALRGNVETELASASDQAGCGCGYPEWVSDAEVARSNTIIERLRQTAQREPARVARLAQLPMHGLAQVGQTRVAIVHGDCWSLAGWSFAQERLEAGAVPITAAFAQADVDVFASSHTCLPVGRAFATSAGPRLLINNGAAGMPNFAGTTYGLMSRIALTPAADALYRARHHGVFIESLPIRYDHVSWLGDFRAWWPAGSPASDSYLRRISEGPAYRLEQAVRDGFAVVD